MDVQQLRRLKPELEQYLDRYVPLLGRAETQAHARQFVQGLLHGGERRNVENISEAMDGGVVRSLQKFIGQAAWDDGDVLEELQRHVTEVLGDTEATLNVDETGFPKKGTKSVGVKRQYAGCLGRTDNCQVGVFVNYRSQSGHTLIDRRLFLPAEWASDRERREEAGVPDCVVFRSKPELAEEMVRAAVERGLPFRWVTGDSVYGDSPTFVRGVRALGKRYVVDVGAPAHVWLSEPTMIPAGQRGKSGRPRTKPRATTKPIPVGDAAAWIAASAWQRIAVADGSQGPRLFEYAELPVSVLSN